MKIQTLLAGLAVTFSALLANSSPAVPPELSQLLPVGSKQIRIEGTTQKGLRCFTDISSDRLGYGITVFELENGADIKSLSKFQIGLGYNVVRVETTGTAGQRTTAVVQKKADEQYSSDVQSTVNVLKYQDGTLVSIRVIEKEKGFFGFKTRADIECRF